MGICAWKETACVVLSQDLWMGASLVAQLVKNPPAICETRVRFLAREDPLEKEMATHSIFSPGEFRGQRSLVGYIPWGHKELDMTE